MISLAFFSKLVSLNKASAEEKETNTEVAVRVAATGDTWFACDGEEK